MEFVKGDRKRMGHLHVQYAICATKTGREKSRKKRRRRRGWPETQPWSKAVQVEIFVYSFFNMLKIKVIHLSHLIFTLVINYNKM